MLVSRSICWIIFTLFIYIWIILAWSAWLRCLIGIGFDAHVRSDWMWNVSSRFMIWWSMIQVFVVFCMNFLCKCHFFSLSLNKLDVRSCYYFFKFKSKIQQSLLFGSHPLHRILLFPANCHFPVRKCCKLNALFHFQKKVVVPFSW